MNLKHVDLNLLVVFDAIYSTASISHAANQLTLSQPAVSNALARLRDLLDDPLFVRDGRTMRPTVKAARMIGPVREALGLIKGQLSNSQDLDLASYKRTFRMVIIDPLEPIVMPSILQLIDAQAPGIGIESVQARPDFVDAIRTGTLDLACITYPIDATDIVAEPLAPVDAVVIARRDHPRIQGRLGLETFASLGHVALVRELRGMTHVDKDLVARGIERRIVYMVNKLWSIAPIVERTDLLGIIPRRFAEEIGRNFAIAIHELPVEIAEQHIFLVYHTRCVDDPGHKWLREAIAAALASKGGTADAKLTALRSNRKGVRPNRSAPRPISPRIA